LEIGGSGVGDRGFEEGGVADSIVERDGINQSLSWGSLGGLRRTIETVLGGGRTVLAARLGRWSLAVGGGLGSTG
jgi:hypothetical protein